jgi:predicted outer membrane protein
MDGPLRLSHFGVPRHWGRRSHEWAMLPGRSAQPGARQAGQGGARGQGGQQRESFADAQIASMLAMGNRNEIEISKFAQEHLQSDEAKEFAANMIKEHTPALQRLQQFAGQQSQGGRRNREAGGNAGAGAQNRREDSATEGAEGSRRSGEGADNAGAGQSRRGLAWGTIHREIADQCLESTKKMLSEHKGGLEFDKAYLGQQVVAHQEMHDKLTVLRNHASSELQQEIDSQLKSTEEHLEHVKKLMDQKKDKPSSGQQQRSNQQK